MVLKQLSHVFHVELRPQIKKLQLIEELAICLDGPLEWNQIGVSRQISLQVLLAGALAERGCTCGVACHVGRRLDVASLINIALQDQSDWRSV